jgi:PilZ domain
MTHAGELIQRGLQRLPFVAEVEVRGRRSLKYRVTLIDFSPAGASLNLVERFEVGDIVWIKLDGLESLESKICWISGFIAGIQFARPLHSSVFAMLIQRLSPPN